LRVETSMRTLIAALAFTGVALLAVNARSQDNAQRTIGECDRLAASDTDLERPASVRGVPPREIDPAVAIPACEAAVKIAPDSRRLIFQLGRTYFAAKDYQKSLDQYRQAEALGHIGAAHNLGIQHLSGYGVPRDLTRARMLLEKAATAG